MMIHQQPQQPSTGSMTKISTVDSSKWNSPSGSSGRPAVVVVVAAAAASAVVAWTAVVVVEEVDAVEMAAWAAEVPLVAETGRVQTRTAGITTLHGGTNVTDVRLRSLKMRMEDQGAHQAWMDSVAEEEEVPWVVVAVLVDGVVPVVHLAGEVLVVALVVEEVVVAWIEDVVALEVVVVAWTEVAEVVDHTGGEGVIAERTGETSRIKAHSDTSDKKRGWGVKQSVRRARFDFMSFISSSVLSCC